MWPTHFNEGVAERDHFFGADIETSKFGFCCRGSNKLDDLGQGENGSIEGGDWDVFGEHDMVSCPAAGFAYIEVGCI